MVKTMIKLGAFCALSLGKPTENTDMKLTAKSLRNMKSDLWATYDSVADVLEVNQDAGASVAVMIAVNTVLEQLALECEKPLLLSDVSEFLQGLEDKELYNISELARTLLESRTEDITL